jgi:hypothetical protein
MAVHTRFGGGYPGEGLGLDGRVTVATVDSVVADVMLVAELHRLFPREERLSVIRRSIELEQHPQQNGGEKDGAKNARPCDKIGAALKSLAHFRRQVNSRLCGRTSEEWLQSI